MRSIVVQTSVSGDPNRFVHPEFSFINDCAYFDYQRERVFVRTSKTLRRRKKPRKGARHNRTLRKSKDYVIINTNCPSCNSCDLLVASAGENRYQANQAQEGIRPGSDARRGEKEGNRMQVARTLCQRCGHRFIPVAYQNLDKHFHNLKSWSMYLHVAHQISFGTLHGCQFCAHGEAGRDFLKSASALRVSGDGNAGGTPLWDSCARPLAPFATNCPCRATASPASWEPRRGLPARPWKDLINDGLLRRSEFELFQKFREATSPGCPPPLQLREHARKREGRQVETERLQDAGQNRLAAGAVDRLAGATRQPRLRRVT